MKYVFNAFLCLSLWFLLLAAFLLAAPNVTSMGAELIGLSTLFVAWALTRKVGY